MFATTHFHWPTHHETSEPMRRREPFHFRNPPRFWRRVFLGVALAVPGVVAGLLIAVCVRGPAWLGIAGAVVAFAAGYLWEGK